MTARDWLEAIVVVSVAVLYWHERRLRLRAEANLTTAVNLPLAAILGWTADVYLNDEQIGAINKVNIMTLVSDVLELEFASFPVTADGLIYAVIQSATATVTTVAVPILAGQEFRPSLTVAIHSYA